ncbi:hypothetical protein [Pajaroellobacter abortibovis]|uniref:Uncharacterized protein n=1 Tax=Pajaroellobacter abortibovis TaxID=1882918 RepID=A0A1L6MVV3_9BACT|nr:hypothetical protein [Pajaroellobacter abortibovis]APR99669.1 hypothetical protein BCY86_02500 [Pajaroellobacter abortibovis]
MLLIHHLPRKLLIFLASPSVTSIALPSYAKHFDFFCDDAHIAVRHSKKLVELRTSAYNPGEPLEGYTGHHMDRVATLLYQLGFHPLTTARAAGGSYAVETPGLSWLLWHRI